MKVALLLSRFDMTGMTTNTIDLFEGLRHIDGVHPQIIVGKADNWQNNAVSAFYEKYANDADVVFYKSETKSKFKVARTTWRVIKLLWSGHYDLVHCESPYYTYIPWLCRKKFLSTMHVTDIFPYLYFKRGNHCISISPETTKWAIDVCRFTPEQVTMVEHGVSTRFAAPLDDIRRESTMQSYCIPGGGNYVYISLIGSIEPRKGHDVLLNAVASLPDDIRSKVHLLIVGSDKSDNQKSQQWLDRLIADTKLSRQVTQIKYCDPYPLYKISDIVVLPSRQEGFLLTAIEGMMSGACVVRSNCEGAEVQINDGVDGRIFKVDDVAGLRDVLVQLITQPEYRKSLAAAGQQKAIEKFSNIRMAKDSLAVYNKILQLN